MTSAAWDRVILGLDGNRFASLVATEILSANDPELSRVQIPSPPGFDVPFYGLSRPQVETLLATAALATVTRLVRATELEEATAAPGDDPELSALVSTVEAVRDALVLIADRRTRDAMDVLVRIVEAWDASRSNLDPDQ